MTELWRLYRAAHGPGLDGIGGLFAEGRWHAQGELAVYFGSTPAIAVLERLAHLDIDMLPDDMRLGHFELPRTEDVTPVSALGPLPESWARDEARTRRVGTDWLRGKAACLLAVPSAILPEEANFLFNPRHGAAKSLRLVRERPFSFDARLL